MNLMQNEEFVELVRKYEDIAKQDRKMQDDFYTRNILPYIYRKLKQEQKLEVDNLIILGSGQANTAALLIAVFNPKRIAFLVTSQTARVFPQNVVSKLKHLIDIDELRCPVNTWPYTDTQEEQRPPINPGFFQRDHSSITAIYEGVRDIFDYWKGLGIKQSEIFLDLTGGMSTMTVGAAKSAHVLDLSSIYITSQYQNNKIIEGSQRIEFVPNPYKVFGDLEAEEAKRLYRSHDYNGAQRIFAKLAKEVPEAQRYQLYADLSEAYDAWEVLDFKKAAVKLAAVLNNINHDSALHSYIHQLQEQLNSAQELSEITSTVGSDDRNSKLSVLADKNKILHLLSTLRSIAKRRASNERYDVAALYQYRAIELISQHRLATYHCLASDIDYSQITDPQSGQQIAKNDLKNRYINKHRLVIDARRRRQPNDRTQLATDLPSKKPGLFASYNLLAALDDPFLQNYNWVDIEVRTETRNNSILAHGYRLITQNEFESFAQVAEELYSRLLELYSEDGQVWEARSQFIQPFL